MTYIGPDLKRKNIRLALLLGIVALVTFFTSVPFWKGLFKALGTQAL
jgi:hypothetical protein